VTGVETGAKGHFQSPDITSFPGGTHKEKGRDPFLGGRQSTAFGFCYYLYYAVNNQQCSLSFVRFCESGPATLLRARRADPRVKRRPLFLAFSLLRELQQVGKGESGSRASRVP